MSERHPPNPILQARIAAGTAWGPEDEKEARKILRELASLAQTYQENLTSVHVRCTELLISNRALKAELQGAEDIIRALRAELVARQKNEFVCDGTCNGTEFSDCSHDRDHE